MLRAHATPGGTVYAKALFEAVDAQGGESALRDVGSRLEALGEAWEDDRTLRAYFLSGYVSTTEKNSAMDTLSQGHPTLLANFLKLLLDRGRLALLAEIAASYNKLLDERLGRVPVTLTTAVAVDDVSFQAWKDKIAAAIGGEPIVRHVVKPEIVAGAVIRVGDRVVDGSARRRLNELHQQIIQRGKQIHALQS